MAATAPSVIAAIESKRVSSSEVPAEQYAAWGEPDRCGKRAPLLLHRRRAVRPQRHTGGHDGRAEKAAVVDDGERLRARPLAIDRRRVARVCPERRGEIRLRAQRHDTDSGRGHGKCTRERPRDPRDGLPCRHLGRRFGGGGVGDEGFVDDATGGGATARSVRRKSRARASERSPAATSTKRSIGTRPSSRRS